MNRTSEFFNYLSQQRRASPPKPSAPRKPTAFSDSARDVSRRLVHASETIATLRSLVHGGNILGQDEGQMQDLILNLNRDLAVIDQKIKDIEKMKSQPQHASNVAQSLRRNQIWMW